MHFTLHISQRVDDASARPSGLAEGSQEASEGRPINRLKLKPTKPLQEQ
jgi:hypothetical protein